MYSNAGTCNSQRTLSLHKTAAFFIDRFRLSFSFNVKLYKPGKELT